MNETFKVEGARNAQSNWNLDTNWCPLGVFTDTKNAHGAITSAMSRGGYSGFRITRVTEEVVYLCEQKMRMEVVISKGV